MSIIGYIRVSSQKQTLAHQYYEIKKFAEQNNITVGKWIQETISSRKPLARRKLWGVLNDLQPNDILLATEISRLGRSLMEVMGILETCLNKNCQVWTIKENYRLGNDIQSKVMAFAFGLSAEIERNLISQRTKASLDDVRARGRRLGRPFSRQTRKLNLNRNSEQIEHWLNIGMSRYWVSQKLRVSPSTLAHFVERMGWAHI